MIAEGEHQQQDFKFEVNDPRKLAITLSAFANTDGGRLLIGVKDNGNIRGVKPDEEFHMVQLSATRYCIPAVKIISRIWKLNDKQVLEAAVEAVQQKPVLALDEKGKGWAYVRVKDENLLAHPVMLELWKQEQSPKEFWLQYKSGSEQLVKVLGGAEPLGLEEICKLTSVPRRMAILQLAYLVRWGLVQLLPGKDRFLFLQAVAPKEI